MAALLAHAEQMGRAVEHELDQFHLPRGAGFLEQILELRARGVFADAEFVRDVFQPFSDQWRRSQVSLTGRAFDKARHARSAG